eukprot:2970599-Karenia_brevis.AAC.1
MDARAAFHTINEFGKQMPLPPANPPVGIDAADVNISNVPDVFSDGSLSDSTHPEFALATAAVWWPDRHVDDKPLSSHEFQFSRDQQSSD